VAAAPAPSARLPSSAPLDAEGVDPTETTGTATPCAVRRCRASAVITSRSRSAMLAAAARASACTVACAACGGARAAAAEAPQAGSLHEL
jgi:hypothetical protein